MCSKCCTVVGWNFLAWRLLTKTICIEIPNLILSGMFAICPGYWVLYCCAMWDVRVIEPTIYFITGTTLQLSVRVMEAEDRLEGGPLPCPPLYLTCYTSQLLLQPQASLRTPDSASSNQGRGGDGLHHSKLLGGWRGRGISGTPH